MKIYECDHCGLFEFAEKEFGIHWNAANDLFFYTILEYGQINKIYPSEWQCQSAFYQWPEIEETERDKTKLQWDTLDQESKAWFILGAYFYSIKKINATVYLDCT